MELFAKRRGLRLLLILLGWSASTSAIVLAAVYQGLLVPALGGPFALGGQPATIFIYFLGVGAISLISAMVIDEPSFALIGFFASYVLAGVISSTILSLPAIIGGTALPDILTRVAVTITFTAFFPLVLIAGLLGTFVGMLLPERLGLL